MKKNIKRTYNKISQKDVNKLLKSENTINLAWWMTSDQMRAKRNKRKTNLFIRENLLELIVCLMAIIFFLAWFLCTFLSNTTYANNKEEEIKQDYAYFINRFPLEKMIIGCYNDITKETRQASVCTKRWDHNIKLPPRSHIIVWLKYYTPHQILNRLAIPNFESDFNIYAKNKYAKWYVQTLKSHNVNIDIDSQLAWLKNRESKTYAKRFYAWKYWKIRWCGYYWDNYNFKDWAWAWEYWVLTCMYRYHYDANNWIWYWKRWVKATKFYKKYLFWME